MNIVGWIGHRRAATIYYELELDDLEDTIYEPNKTYN